VRTLSPLMAVLQCALLCCSSCSVVCVPGRGGGGGYQHVHPKRCTYTYTNAHNKSGRLQCHVQEGGSSQSSERHACAGVCTVNSSSCCSSR
jgi:hypothetical protein